MQTTVLADSATHKVQRPQALRSFWDYPDVEIPKVERIERFRVPEELPRVGERPVYHSDLDANGHMNNCVYGDIVSDFLPKALLKSVGVVQINYLSETEEGDRLAIYGGEDNGLFLLRGENSHGVSFTASVQAKSRPTE